MRKLLKRLLTRRSREQQAAEHLSKFGLRAGDVHAVIDALDPGLVPGPFMDQMHLYTDNAMLQGDIARFMWEELPTDLCGDTVHFDLFEEDR